MISDTISSQVYWTEFLINIKLDMFEQQNQEPTPNFINNVFSQLAKKKNESVYKEYPQGTVFKGYKTIPIQALQNKTKFTKAAQGGRSLWTSQKTKEVFFYDESCSLSEQSNNGFFAAFYQAYVNHGDLKITPDDVWMAIMLFFSKYADDNAEALRKAFVNHEGKKELLIKTYNTTEYQWDEFYEKIIVAVKENTVPGVTEKLQSSFTTTDKFFHFFSTTVIMNTFKKYFDYTRMMCICGIQNIHMGGQLSDWQLLIKKASSLQQFDVNGELKYYINNLIPILDQFVQTYKGSANLEFWNNLYHERANPHSGAYQPKSFINGWILRFFGTQEIINDRQKLKIEAVNIPLKLINQIKNTTSYLNILGGCKGISIQNERIFRPHYSFSIVEHENGWKDEQQ